MGGQGSISVNPEFGYLAFGYDRGLDKVNPYIPDGGHIQSHLKAHFNVAITNLVQEFFFENHTSMT